MYVAINFLADCLLHYSIIFTNLYFYICFYDVSIIISENNNFVPFPKGTKLLIFLSLSAESRTSRTKLSDHRDYMMVGRNMAFEDRRLKFKT